jgi:predicted nucleic acid-binding protein
LTTGSGINAVNRSPAVSYLLDTTAIIALIEEEDGFERVRAVLAGEHCIIPWVVLLEVFYKTMQKRGEKAALARYATLRALPAEIIWDAGEPELIQAGKLKAECQLSFADAIIAAHALLHKAVLLHKDPEFESLPESIRQEKLPYKTRRS